VSTFKCKGGKKGEVVVTYDSFGKASFFSTNAIAYFGSWYEKEVSAIHTDVSSSLS
jgi:hypothetical protein